MKKFENNYNMNKKDFIFLGILFIIGLVISLFIYLPHTKSGSFVQVRIDGKIVSTYTLSKDRTEIIRSDTGTNTLCIHSGVASMTDADCKDKVCTHMNGISKIGETIVCLPHKVVIEVTDESGTGSLDAVTGSLHSLVTYDKRRALL